MRLLYLLAEVVTLYAILMAMCVGVIWGARGFDDVGQLIILVCAVVNLGAAFKLVLVGDRPRSIWTGFYNPIRLLAMLLPGISALLRSSTLPGLGGRREFRIELRGAPADASYDAIEALSRRLRRDHIAFVKSGGLMVEDNSASWWVEPEIGAPRLTGWIEAASGHDRQQILDGLESFLRDDLRLEPVIAT